MPFDPTQPDLDRERAEFRRLQARLRDVWAKIEASSQPAWKHTSVVVPSLSFDTEELAKIQGVSFYEERLLFSLMRLRHPGAHVIYITSQPIHPEIIDYYLQMLVGVPAGHARKRLALICVEDASPRPLSQKVLERPRVIRRIREWIGNLRRAYLTVFNSTALERRLAIALGIPLNALDPELLGLGTKSGSRDAFEEAGVPLPRGTQHLKTRDDVVEALADLAVQRPGIRRAVVKLNDSFAGEGNALFEYPTALSDDPVARRETIIAALGELACGSEGETSAVFLRKIDSMGGVVEEFLEAPQKRSPSVQLRIVPDGSVELISTHEQLIGGPTGQMYLGCRFPAVEEYRTQIQDQAMAIGRVLAERGVVSRLAIDFLATRGRPGDAWNTHAIEINLRMGGTTHPFLALEFLTGGSLCPETGLFRSPRGNEKYYVSTDALKSPRYRGLLPEDLMEIVTNHGLHFQPSTERGILFHMIGGLSQFGKVGVTCIGNDAEDADELYRHTVHIMDRETGARGRSRGKMIVLHDGVLPKME